MKLIDYLTQSKKRFLNIKFYLEDENNKFQSKSLDNGDYEYEYPYIMVSLYFLNWMNKHKNPDLIH